MSSIEVRSLNAFYGDIQVLWDVSMKVEPGEIASIIGSNGAGKSTLLRSILGLVPAKSGTIIFDGKRIEKLPPNRIVETGIAYVPEGRRLFPDLTVQENLIMGSYPHSARKDYRESLESVYGIFPILKEKAKQRAGSLSGGEAQMLAISRALMSRPKLLMLDEPSAGLAPKMVSKIFDALIQISKSGVTILMVEQDVVKALSMSSNAYLLENGRITKSGVGKDLLKDQYIRKAYLGF